MSRSAFESAHPIVQAWLEGCQHNSAVTASEGYALWEYQRDAMGFGTLELVDDPTLSQGHDVVAMSLQLQLPPVRSAEDANVLFELADWLNGITIVSKDFGAGGTLSLQLKLPMTGLTTDALTKGYRQLVEAKRFIEES